MKASQNRFQSNGMDRNHVQRTNNAEEWKEDSIYSAVDPAARSTVYETAIRRVRQSENLTKKLVSANSLT
ncbi:hypothetical protein AUI06_03330 [archaeon 13_2_20CM_2_52_21]|nr:MAG: hypothetical protein AUI06_03330 [archaeon 13_2_20CM_2_52_21]OLD08980.1 MAG: hypothetical protein AUI95_01915 [Crenarchaeota archaeon 13_1_40CM_3_52_4]